MANALFQLLAETDLEALLSMMNDFYAQQQMSFDRQAAGKAVKNLLQDPELGQIYLIFRGADLAGYFAMTFCYSLEFHGRFALLDELYILQPFRRQKLGKAVVAFAETVCRSKRIKAFRLEVGRDNSAAQALYRATGFEEDARNLMTKWM